MQVFKQFEDSEIELTETSLEEVSGWVYPDRREDPNKLSSVSLTPPTGDAFQTEPGKTVPRYFYKVYDTTPQIKETDAVEYPMFTVTYGNADGGGSAGNLPTKAIYKQYVNSVLRDGETSFEGFERDHFYAINLNRRVFRRGVVPGKWELSLNFGQSGVTLKDKSTEDPRLEEELEIPVIGGGVFCGYVYPQKGIIVLDPDVLGTFADSPENIIPEVREADEILYNSSSYGFRNERWQGGFGADRDADDISDALNDAIEEYSDWPYFRNHQKIFDAIDRGDGFTLTVNKLSIKSTYTVNIGETEFNHSFNPTYISNDSLPTFPGNGSYFTGIGLYDDEYRLLAVAKLESPERKTRNDEYSIDVEISY